jgi:hypothetical protein
MMLLAQPSGPELNAVKQDIYDQKQRNAFGDDPGPYALRLTNLTMNLQKLKDSQWFSGRPAEQIDVFAAEEGKCLESKRPAELSITNFMRDEAIYKSYESARKFLWAVVCHWDTPPRTIFLDAETCEIGVYDCEDGIATYNFPLEQDRALAPVENSLGHLFFPGSITFRHPIEVDLHYAVLPSPEASAA